MNILTSIKSLFSEPTGLLCPRCERSIEGHDEAECSRRMSRRYFFGTVAGGVVAVAAAKILPESGIAIDRGLSLEMESGGFLIVQRITYEMLAILNNNMVATQNVVREYDKLYRHYKPIGDTIQVRRPRTLAGVA